MDTKKLRILLIKEGAWWTAQGIDINVAVQGRTLTDVEREFNAAALATIRICEAEGADWTEVLFAPVPRKYHELYADARHVDLFIQDQVTKLLGDNPQSEAKFYEAPVTECTDPKVMSVAHTS